MFDLCVYLLKMKVEGTASQEEHTRIVKGLNLMPDKVPKLVHGLFSVPEVASASDYCLTSDKTSDEVGQIMRPCSSVKLRSS